MHGSRTVKAQYESKRVKIAMPKRDSHDAEEKGAKQSKNMDSRYSDEKARTNEWCCEKQVKLRRTNYEGTQSARN